MNRRVNAADTAWPARLKRLLVVAVILVLGLCAMPNLYQNTTQLSIITLTSEPAVPSPDQLVQLLQSRGFTVADIESGEPTLVTLTPQTASAAAQEVLAEALRGQASVKVVEQATAPYWLQRLGLSPIKLGLDLNGGVLFVLKVDTEKALEKRMENIALEAKALRIRDKLKGVRIERSSVSGLELVALPQREAALHQLQSALLEQFQHLSVSTHQQGSLLRATLSYDETGKVAFEKQTMTQALTTLRSRIEELGITEAVTQRQGANYIRIELPGVQDPAAAKRIIGATAQLSFHALQEFGGKRVKAKHGMVGLDPRAIFTGADIDSAQAGRDEYGKPLVQLFLSSQGGDKMLRFSRTHVGQPMATMYSEYIADSGERSAKAVR